MILMKKILFEIIKLILFILIWWGMATISEWQMPLKSRPVTQTEFFRFCVLVDGKIQSQSLQDYKKGEDVLCHTPVPDDGNGWFNYKYYFDITPEQTYRLISYADSPADPYIYHYRIENQEIVPIDVQYGGLMNQMAAWFYGLILTMILWAVGYRLYLRYFRQPEKTIPKIK